MGPKQFFQAESKYLIIGITMYNGYVMQDEAENEVFFHPHYLGINEKLNPVGEDDSYTSYVLPAERVDQINNFLRINDMDWKDQFHEYKVIGAFIETLMKTFDLKVEMAIHDLVDCSREICLVQAGFVDEESEANAPMFEIYQSQDFKNRKFSKFLTNFFSSRGLKFEKRKKAPEPCRLINFWQEERDKIKIYGLYLYVNKAKFIEGFEREEDGIWALKKIMEEFYSELDYIFECRNAFVSTNDYRLNEQMLKKRRKDFQKNRGKAIFFKADADQFFIKCDKHGVELLDFVHLKIWNYPDELDMGFVIENHLPNLEFNVRDSNRKEFELQKERLSYVL